jgi:hypothetical protein
LDRALGLQRGDSGVNVLGDDIATVQQAGGHVLAVAWVALNHLVVWLEAGHGDLLDGVGLVGSLRGGDDWGVGNEREVDTWVGDEVGLELVQVDVEGAIEAEGGGDGRDDCITLALTKSYRMCMPTLCDETVQVLVVGTLNAQIAAADIVDGLIVDHETAVGVLKSGMRSENGVVWLDHGGGDLRGRVDAELELALLAIVHRQTLHQQCTKARAGTTTEGVEDQEALQTRAVVGNTAHFVQNLVNELLADGVVTTSIVVRRVLLASDHLLGVEQAAVGTGADLIDDIGLEIAVDGAGDIFALASLGEEGRKTFVVVGLGLALLSKVAVGLDAVLEAVQLPARVCDLATCLSHYVQKVSCCLRACKYASKTYR